MVNEEIEGVLPEILHACRTLLVLPCPGHNLLLLLQLHRRLSDHAHVGASLQTSDSASGAAKTDVGIEGIPPPEEADDE